MFFLENPDQDEIMTKLQEQFNAQRAKMRELYLHKEKECVQQKQKLIMLKKELDEASSQFVIEKYNGQKDLEDQRNEIKTLQQLLQARKLSFGLYFSIFNFQYFKKNQETCEEATVASNEISILKSENERGRQEIKEMKDILMQQQQVNIKIS